MHSGYYHSMLTNQENNSLILFLPAIPCRDLNSGPSTPNESKEINALDRSATIAAYSHFCNFLDLLQRQFHHLMSIKLTSKITIPITIHKKQSKCLLLKLPKWIVKIITASVIKMDFKSVKYYSKVQ